MAAALSCAFAAVYGRRFRRMRVDPILTAAGQITASALILAPLALLVERPWTLASPGPRPRPWAAVAGLALLSTAMALSSTIQFWRAGATNLALVTPLIPVSAVLLGAVMLGERLTWTHGLGMPLVGAGLAVLNGRLLRGVMR